MLFFLQLLGGIVLSLAILAGLVYLYFKWKFGKYLDFDEDHSGEPLYIHLNEQIEPNWLEAKKVKLAASELESLGFKGGKAYSIHEMNGVCLQGFYKSPFAAVLYSHEIAGSWIDIVFDEVDGKEYTVSNAPMGSQMEERPETQKVFDAKLSVAEIYAKAEHLQASLSGGFVDIHEGNFREYFETAYKKDIAFRTRKGGISYEEFLASSKEAPFRSSDETVQEAFITCKEQELFRWHEAALEEYRVSENIDMEKFYDIEFSMLIVPFTTHPPAFVQYLLAQDFIDCDQEEQLSKVAEDTEDVNQLFDRINDLLSPELRATFVKDIDYPLPIKLYKMSPKMIDC
ncbi:hypothetical protein [Pseudoteredinibacter isoporae]|uniref:Uncharacterized protein n=1 Tax=Pseudoteredinibacter isoporae TaxID=570281 RepID=A0A7X0MVM7_9GAMM|nr:hypothetical protein [Pseudoteredinibacter isoporae]MBB6520009.1 hypothetical protein [Pseudoteredinibacter isoporae]NHO85581.1 hypothetical protein [Pseudoteredinibacter isoporae]NIB25967.1 hypothetical protein [Pseudoteredinibacter isoporae]